MTFKENQCCGFRISAQAQPNMTLAADECAFTTYGPPLSVLTAPTVQVAYWGPGQTIPAIIAQGGVGLQVPFIGGVVFKNC